MHAAHSQDEQRQVVEGLEFQTTSYGWSATVNLPGGALRPEDWQHVASLSREHSGEAVYVTTHGGLEFRGTQQPEAFARSVREAGWLSSQTHYRRRAIVASPLSPTLWPLAAELDRVICEDPELAAIASNAVIGIDDGSGDVTHLAPEVCLVRSQDQDQQTYHVVIQSALSTPEPLPAKEATDVAIAVLRRWSSKKNGESNPQGTLADAATEVLPSTVGFAHRAPASTVGPIGWIEQGSTVALAAGFPQRRCEADIAELLGMLGKPTALTCWSSVVVHDLTPEEADVVVRVLAPRGLVFDANVHEANASR